MTLGLAPAPSRDADGDRQVIGAIVGVQLAASLGFYAVMAHVVAHMREDLGLLAATIGLVLGVRMVVQYALFLPVGAVTDLLGATRMGALACVLRAGGFALLGTAGGVIGLLSAAVLLGVGGALFHPAAQSLLAGVAPARRARGFAAYVMTGQIAAVAGPPAGLVLLSGGLASAVAFGLPGGFGLLAAAAAAAWTVAAVLFVMLHRQRRDLPSPAGAREVAGGVTAVLRDRAFLRFAVACAPSLLLADATVTVIPLTGFGPAASTMFFCLSATAAASIQPWCAAGDRARRPWALRTGLLCAGAGYVLLVPLGGGRLTCLLIAATLNGLAKGVVQPSIFQTTVRYAPPARIGAYLGVAAFLSGMVAFAGGLAVGRLFDAGDAGATTALVGLVLLGALSAAACGRSSRSGQLSMLSESVTSR
ncbi:MFS transporter [Actinomadura sp. HBU206391]|uniref:MFS transporter n=1 Tax=Actinomadura sp. HBU206391 TaxID=2731692 RepID=UPI001650CF6A|nr:MFS transporter [Actinomadura sp. HBU206391]MBC6460219.1 MFS transporter [Actinomadura sp. HBU206391]